MKTIRIYGWEPGFNKVEMTKLLREELGSSLFDAKEMVDKIVSCEQIEISVNPESIERITYKLDQLKAKFEILDL
ncbi:hypothetical protein FCE95_09475 [Luteimonas gilva]|uniref:Uncharacterized protein n=1 Tax=Luteimonas gilva TaxID=2572684 RepID=A0A4V5ZPT2_9GAMM|nr:hypothetical protein FCE95_09475 [Luteimonas gilva]